MTLKAPPLILPLGSGLCRRGFLRAPNLSVREPYRTTAASFQSIKMLSLFSYALTEQFTLG
jgi:hypothetical protein